MLTSMADRPAVAPGSHRRSRLPWHPGAAPLAAASLVTAAAHLPVTNEHLDGAPYVGLLLIALELACVVLAVVLLVRPTRAAMLTTATVGVLAVHTFLLSRTVGLPQIGFDVGNWREPLAVVSVLAEVVMGIGGSIASLFDAKATTHRIRLAGVVAGAFLLIAGAAATGLAASVETAPYNGTTETGTQVPGHPHPGMPGMRMGASTSVLPDGGASEA